jgi:monooxygenase
MSTDFDVLIVGAGISGIGMACYLHRRLPDKTYAILEGRDAIGGTWDLFRYPGIRSDSDLYTFGFEFKPWTSVNMIAGADEIVAYFQEAIDEHDVQDKIRFGHRVVGASWSTADARWTVRFRDADGDEGALTARWLYTGTGYYDYEGGFRPVFPGEDDFAGQLIHPQAWPEDLDYDGKEVVVIGSGATAVTMIPAMADRVKRITMLQRSPGYIVPVPQRNHVYMALQKVLPTRVAHRIMRKAAVGVWRGVYLGSQNYPRAARRLIQAITKLQLPKGVAVDPNFDPNYDPWDQRLCAVPNGDLFRVMRAGKASVVTDHVERFTERGILLASGRELEADIIVTATGLNMLPLGGMQLTVDGAAIVPSETVAFKSMMLSGVPNFVFALGYTNISWTLKIDLICEHLCRLIEHMDESGYSTVVPELDDPTVERLPFFGDFAAGYMQRGQLSFWRGGSHGPWTSAMDYPADLRRLREGSVQDPALRFTSADREPALAA